MLILHLRDVKQYILSIIYMDKIRKFVSKNKTLSFLIKPAYRRISGLYYNIKTKNKPFDSKKYWEDRYVSKSNSGAGSYGRLALFKAEVINDFVEKNNINSAIEFGCGDGNQLSLLKIPKYIGLDVSKKSIELCKGIFAADQSKSFFLYDPQYFINKTHVFETDLTMSLDVIFHLVENEIFEKYMHDLFSCSKKYVIIYSSNTDDQGKFMAQHVLLRKFSNWIEKNASNWKLITKINNKYPLNNNPEEESLSDFYIYTKK